MIELGNIWSLTGGSDAYMFWFNFISLFILKIIFICMEVERQRMRSEHFPRGSLMPTTPDQKNHIPNKRHYM